MTPREQGASRGRQRVRTASVKSLAAGPGCPRHAGDPHSLCPECWKLEPDPARLSVSQGGIGDTHGFFLPPTGESRDAS